MMELPKNCWRVTVDQEHARQQYQIYQQATALILLDIWISRILDQGSGPATVFLFWYDDTGQEHLLVEARLSEQMSTVTNTLSHPLLGLLAS